MYIDTTVRRVRRREHTINQLRIRFKSVGQCRRRSPHLTSTFVTTTFTLGCPLFLSLLYSSTLPYPTLSPLPLRGRYRILHPPSLDATFRYYSPQILHDSRTIHRDQTHSLIRARAVFTPTDGDVQCSILVLLVSFERLRDLHAPLTVLLCVESRLSTPA